MNKTNISWCDYTWNPITGCKRGCKYCYARRLHDKRHEAYKQGCLQNMKQYSVRFDEIMFHPDRLNDPILKSKKPKIIFVGSMSDPEYWGDDATDRVLNVCVWCKWHTFMFLSKSPFQYTGWSQIENIRIGLTLEKCNDAYSYEKLMYHAKENYRNKKFLSIEPLLGKFEYTIPGNIELVIVGAMTGKDSVAPEKEWIQSVVDHYPSGRIHWKPNIHKYLKQYGFDNLIPEGV